MYIHTPARLIVCLVHVATTRAVRIPGSQT